MFPRTSAMKLLVFAHIPPPHHGQSYMVKLMLDRFGGDARGGGGAESDVQCYHVDSRYSDTLEDIGSFRFGKAWLVLRYCLEAIWCRFRYGVRAFYYVPAPGKRAALYRDWLVMLFCRPFFSQFIHHWHAVGLGDWLRRDASWFERWLTPLLFDRPSLGLALSITSMRDALWFKSERVEVVPNGIPDPCADFMTTVLIERRGRLESRRMRLAGGAAPVTVRLLFLAHCTESKGLFDTLEALKHANALAEANGGGFRFELTVAGVFVKESEERRFRERSTALGLDAQVNYVGFVSGETKSRLLHESDFMCFPTYYEAEGQPVNLLEAMAFGLAPVATRWRGIPDMLPASYPGLVPIKSPKAVAETLWALLSQDHAMELRECFLAHYTEQQHIEALRRALATLEVHRVAVASTPTSAPA
jgi:glycosyltransferase involved in cell wall biosynthesis